MRKLFTKTLLVVGIVFATTTAHAGLNLCQGTMTTGGIAAFTLGNPPVGQFINNITGSDMGLNINLDFGYFVMDYLSLDVGFLSNVTFSSPAAASVGLQLGATYYFDLGSMINPYIGVHPGIAWSTRNNVSRWDLRVPASLGMLIALNEHVALDVGAQVGLGWDLTNSTGTRLDLTVGYVGVQAFF